MGPSFEHILVASILPPSFDIDHIDWSEITQKELECSQLNACVINFLRSNLCEDLQDIIFDIEEVRNDAHLIWKLLIATYATPECINEDQVEEELPKECSKSCQISMHTQVSLLAEKKGQDDQDMVPLQELVRLVGQTDQTGSSRETSSVSATTTYEGPSQASFPTSSITSNDEADLCLMAKKKEEEASLEEVNEVLIAQLDMLTSKHKALQATHKELECSHERLVESYAILDIAHEVMVTSLKTTQPLTHTCSCSQVEINSFSTNPCCSQTSQSSIEHVFVESCDDLVARENDELTQEVERLKKDLSELRGKSQVQPSQDNHEDMVKKLEKGSTDTCSTPQLHLKNNKSKIQEENNFKHIKCFNCSKMGHFASTCPNKLKEKKTFSNKQRICYKCKEKGHIGATCSIEANGGKTDPDRLDRSSGKCKQEKQEDTVSRKDKIHICYTCWQKGQMGKDCPNGNVLNSNLVHYDFSNLRNDKVGTYAIKVIDSPQTSVRAIWVPKNLVTNLRGPNKKSYVVKFT
ncbi:hypothetical protein SETIT_3G171100v2 [Setaria italica]|uniref:CCHC-type domain-containing protein n=1 Tax=Setaria italica TaxID=4555 RepID=K3ZFF5_SETIT|nr:hypothetical protein SETIT_3G171100v2 [Setaria italica]